MGAFDNPGFWSSADSATGTLKSDGSLRYILLDKTYKMMPLIRDSDTTFLDFLSKSQDAKKCDVVINGNFYGLDRTGKIWVGMGKTDDPSDTEIEGQVVLNGRVIGGDSRPQSFWFGQVAATTMDPWRWTYAAEQGDPPANKTTMAAIGGLGPLIAGAMKYGTCSNNTLTYGIGNLYRSGAPAGVFEPPTGQPPPAAMPYLIQRNNATFVAASQRAPETGKTIVAYCSVKRTLLVAVQKDGLAPGQTHASLTASLAQRGFDAAVFMDGSDSATLLVGGSVIVAPGNKKNSSIDVGVGFFK
jgi:hypothetical protein